VVACKIKNFLNYFSLRVTFVENVARDHGPPATLWNNFMCNHVWNWTKTIFSR